MRRLCLACQLPTTMAFLLRTRLQGSVSLQLLQRSSQFLALLISLISRSESTQQRIMLAVAINSWSAVRCSVLRPSSSAETFHLEIDHPSTIRYQLAGTEDEGALGRRRGDATDARHSLCLIRALSGPTGTVFQSSRLSTHSKLASPCIAGCSYRT